MDIGSRDRNNILLFLDCELRAIKESPYKFINDFERIDGMCIRESYVVARVQVFADNIKNINDKSKWFYLKSDII